MNTTTSAMCYFHYFGRQILIYLCVNVHTDWQFQVAIVVRDWQYVT